MTDDVLSPLQRGKARLLEHVTEAWKAAHASAMMAWDLEETVRLLASLPAEWQRSWNDLVQRLGSGRVDDADTVLLQMREHFDDTLRTAEETVRLVSQVEADGFRVANAAELPLILGALRALREHAFRNWSGPLTAQDVADAQAAYLRGECQELDDAFAEAAGVDKATWLRRLEEYRRQRLQIADCRLNGPICNLQFARSRQPHARTRQPLSCPLRTG